MQPKVNSENYPRVAYGLDLAGYSQGKKSALARVEWPGGDVPVNAEVLIGHPFAKKQGGTNEWHPKNEQDEIERRLSEGRLCVDVPIDLQGLMGLDVPERSGHSCPRRVWELTFRPVDYAFRALPPLADRIGAPVVRFRNILTKSQRSQLGSRLWETYPGAILELLTRTKPRYKTGKAESERGAWFPNRRGCAADEELACLATELSITANAGTELNDDELDAVLCALTGIAPSSALLFGCGLEEVISCRINRMHGTEDTAFGAPKG